MGCFKGCVWCFRWLNEGLKGVKLGAQELTLLAERGAEKGCVWAVFGG